MIHTVGVTRYVTPLREGGSLPGIVEADDLGTYVCKFRGAGQGVRVLVAEVVVGGLARAARPATPRMVGLDLDPEIARYEADEEVQDLLNASPGLNLGIDFLPGAFGYDGETPDGGRTRPRVLWLDAFCANVDRTWRNPNLLVWHGDLWVIDHGASLYFHHGWGGGIGDPERFAGQPWSLDDHVFLSPRRRAGPGRRRDARPARRGACSARFWPRSPTPGSSRCRAPTRRTPLRAAYAAFLGARLGPASGCRRWWHEPTREARPTSTSCCAACPGSTARSSSTSAWCCTASPPTSSMRPGTSTGTGCAPLDPRIDLDQVCEALTFVEGVCAGDERGGAAAGAPTGQRFGFLKAPRSTVLQPGPVHGGVTADPGRQLERLLEQLVG